jgi:hypothetical protein
MVVLDRLSEHTLDLSRSFNGMLLLQMTSAVRSCRERSCDSENIKSWAGCRGGAGNEKEEKSSGSLVRHDALDPLILRPREKARLSIRGDAPGARTIDMRKTPGELAIHALRIQLCERCFTTPPRKEGFPWR